MLPDLFLNYFTGTNTFQNAKRYNGFQAGLSVPLFFGSQKSRIEAARISLNATQLYSENQIIVLKTRMDAYKKEEQKYREAIDFYNTSGKQLHDEILRATMKSYQLGEIDLFRFTGSYENAVKLKMDYLDNVLKYNLIILEQKYPAY